MLLLELLLEDHGASLAPVSGAGFASGTPASSAAASASPKLEHQPLEMEGYQSQSHDHR